MEVPKIIARSPHAPSSIYLTGELYYENTVTGVFLLPRGLVGSEGSDFAGSPYMIAYKCLGSRVLRLFGYLLRDSTARCCHIILLLCLSPGALQHLLQYCTAFAGTTYLSFYSPPFILALPTFLTKLQYTAMRLLNMSGGGSY